MSNSVGPMDCSPPGFSVHGIVHARRLEWVAVSSSRGSSPPTGLLRLLHWQVSYLPLVPPGKHLYRKESINFQKFCNVIQNIILLIVYNKANFLVINIYMLLFRSFYLHAICLSFVYSLLLSLLFNWSI